MAEIHRSTNVLRRSTTWMLCILGLLPMSQAAFASSVEGLIIKYADTGKAAERRAALLGTLERSQLESASIPIEFKRLMSNNAVVYRFPQAPTEAQAQQWMQALAAQDNVEYIELDRRVKPLFVPNDTLYASQWNLFSDAGGVRAPDAWDITQGTSAGIVAILDSGILTHADISASRVLTGYDFITDITTANDGDGRDSDPTDPGDAVAANECDPVNGSSAADSSWHGLNIASLISANTDNNAGMAGINHVSAVLPVRVLGKCGGLISDIVDGMRWAVGIPVPGVPNNPTPARVLNLSFGGVGACLNSEQSAIDDVVNAGAVVVAAAGNEAVDAQNNAPASCDKVVAVAATTISGSQASYSNFGQSVDISAPGGDVFNGILVAGNTGTGAAASDTYYSVFGTSFAAAQVSGVFSLMFSANPQLTPDQAACALRESARAFPDGSCTTTTCGAGIVDAQATSLPSACVPSTSSSGGGGGGVVVFLLVGLGLPGLLRRVG